MRGRRVLQTPRQFDPSLASRRGTALVVVLVVVVLLSLGAYTYSQVMITEYRAADTYARRVQSELWATSGVEYVAALLTPDGGGWDSDLYNNQALFHMALSESGGFSILAPIEDEGLASASQTGNLRFGLIDECARLNVNVLATFDPVEGPARDMLMALPNMTEDVADAILDWIDDDDDIREYGAESLDYSVALPRNGPVDSLEELLLVLGVTPELMYGEDANRNGVLDPNENDAEQSLPMDNSDGVLDLGWSQYLTVYSLEGNYRHEYDRFGEERIDVNQGLMTELYDQIVDEEGDEELAYFITAFRAFGPVADETEDIINSTTGTGTTGSSGNTGSPGSTGTSGNSGPSGNNGSSGNGNQPSGLLQAPEGSVTRGDPPMDLSGGAAREIASLYELIDAQVTAKLDDGTEYDVPNPITLEWAQSNLPYLLDAFATKSDSVIEGRININQARREVLLGIPDMPLDVPDGIIASRANLVTGAASTLDLYSTTGWLLMQGLVDLETMAKLDQYLTTRGEVYRMQVVGHADRGGPVTRVEAVVDASESIPRIVFQRNLSELGPGFRAGQLPAFGGE